MNWKSVKSKQDLEQAKANSSEKPVVIFKHSTRCGISSMALSRLERNWKDEEMKEVAPYYLDLIQHRDLSQAVAEMYDIRHESPQLLLIKDGTCVYHSSHMEVSYQALKDQLSSKTG